MTKITLAIPEGKEFKKQLEQELALSKNIKDKANRESIKKGLGKILANYSDKKVFLWDGTKLTIYGYYLKEFIYQCGKDFVIPTDNILKNRYLMMTMDANNCSIGMLSGKKLIMLWDKDSFVPRKHDKGGQSQRRFERARQEALKEWMKKVAKKMQNIVYSG